MFLIRNDVDLLQEYSYSNNDFSIFCLDNKNILSQQIEENLE